MADLLWFDKLYGAKFLRRLAEKAGDEPTGVASHLIGTSSGAEIYRAEMDKYLEVIYRHNAMTQDRKRRLYSPTFEVFIQAVHEIMAAWYFEQILGFGIQFDPRGRDESVGEFDLIRGADPRIFAEVKSPVRKVQTPTWWGNDAAAIRKNIKRAAGHQLPEDRPSVVVLCGALRTPISDPRTGILDALYGERLIEVPVGKDIVQPGRVVSKNNGLFQPTSSRRISAVATLERAIVSPLYDNYLVHVLSDRKIPVDDSLPEEVLKYTFKVYHNPYARHRLDRAVFGLAPQFALCSDGFMRWIPTEESA